MSTITQLVLIAIGLLAVGAIFIPSVRQTLRIWLGIGTKKATTAVQRAEDRVKQAEKQIPQLRENVARQMTAAQNAQDAVGAKKKEADTLLTQIETAQNSGASQQTQDTLTLRWKTATDAVPGLETAAKEAHAEAENAQKELEDALQIIAESAAGAEKLKNDAALAAVYRQSTALRNQLNDLKKGLDAGQPGIGQQHRHGHADLQWRHAPLHGQQWVHLSDDPDAFGFDQPHLHAGWRRHD